MTRKRKTGRALVLIRHRKYSIWARESSLSSALFSLSHSIQCFTERNCFPPPFPLSSLKAMECAFKSCIRTESAPKTTNNLDSEFSVGGGGGGGVVSGDDFFVDDLLDLSNGFPEEYEERVKMEPEIQPAPLVKPEIEEEEEEAKAAVTTFSPIEDFPCLPGGEQQTPADNLDNLEWLSHFAEDSFPGYSLTHPPGKQTDLPVREKPSLKTPVQTKARSKRARTGVRVWLSGSQSLTESSTSSSSTTVSSSPPRSYYAYPNPGQTAEWLVGGMPPAKKQRKRAAQPGGGGEAHHLQPQSRRCNHCGVQKTPQWRAGPQGAKTLCNACGVRYKSGRLLPEYRPACSPTFSSQLHSNNHRKVLEMRRKKESETAAVQSF
ncbi:unnamed protein product [Cuscuta epithymum]|uniref:GATA-type domain-containing protein n=1 Tax=Cuscuta epithymum TaxID=186058 RepID=A0AAV0FD45_9ASTE|nr:unnamed protein product [Cuscuta epithymum]